MGLVIYHASPIQNLKELSPDNKSTHDKQNLKKVYASNDIAYASMFAQNWTEPYITAGRINNKPWTLIFYSKRYINLLNKKCSMYYVKNFGFRKIKNINTPEYLKYNVVNVFEEIKFDSWKKMLKYYGVKIIIKNKIKKN